MTATRFSVQKLAYALICLCIVLSVLYIGRSIFIPITFGILFAFMLKPASDRVERIVGNRVVAILLTLLLVGAVIVTVFGFFFVRVSDVLSQADNIVANLQGAWNDLINGIGRFFGMTKRESSRFFTDGFASAMEKPFNILTSGLSTSGYVIGNLFLSILYTFFFLLYRTAFKRFLMAQFRESAQEEGETTIREVQHVAADYLSGMLTVMLVLGVLNSLGLHLIGIQFPLVWGFLGALLAVIPYVGTTLGGLLPLLYAIATTGTLWQPVAVVVLYASVQAIEGNLITPKIVGNSVKINALAAVVSLILGAAFWGLAGLVLAIPLLAMVRIVMAHIKPLKPIALLLSDDLYAHSDKFQTEYYAPEYRLASLFKGNKMGDLMATAGLRRPLARKPANKVSQADPEVVPDAETQ